MSASFGKKIALAVVGLALGMLIMGSVVPLGMSAMQSDDVHTITHVQGASYDVKGNLDARATNVSQSGGTVDVELTDGTQTTSFTVNDGGSYTATIDGAEVDVEVEKINSDTEAQVTYSVPQDYGWSHGASNLWNILPMFAIIGLLALLAGYAMRNLDFSVSLN